jgi:hypothetical protein
MRKIYLKPIFKVKELRPRPLLQNASHIPMNMNTTGKFDAKACSFYNEEDIEDDY